jgi:N-acetylated-alpha-linked acidic dipeptidase
VEEHATELLERGVANLNMDSAVFNPERPLSVAAHPVLHSLFREVSRAVIDPRTGRSTFDVWRDGQNAFRKVPGVDGWGEFFDAETTLERPYVFEAPYDDAAPFFNLLALPASDMYYGADYGMYHSLYENYHWMSTVVDPGFAYHRVMAEIHGRAALRLANAEIVPFDYAEEARFWRKAYADLNRVARERGQVVPRLDEALSRIDAWETEAKALARDVEARLAFPLPPGAASEPAALRIAEISRAVALVARDFYRPEGHPGMPFNRNLFAGWLYETADVSGGTLPGLRFALDRGDLEEAEVEAEVLLAALQRRFAGLRAIRLDLADTP